MLAAALTAEQVVPLRRAPAEAADRVQHLKAEAVVGPGRCCSRFGVVEDDELRSCAEPGCQVAQGVADVVGRLRVGVLRTSCLRTAGRVRAVRRRAWLCVAAVVVGMSGPGEVRVSPFGRAAAVEDERGTEAGPETGPAETAQEPAVITHQDLAAMKLAALVRAGDTGSVRQLVNELEHRTGPWQVDPWRLVEAAAGLAIRHGCDD